MSRYPSIFGGLGAQPTSSTATTTSSPQTLPQQATQQVNALLEKFPNCRSTRPDRSVLELPIRLPDGRTTALTISLLQQFPHERPLLTLPQSVVHPWVGFSGQLDFPSLRAWQYPTSTLLKVVQDACQGLGGRPTTPPPSHSTPPRAQSSQVGGGLGNVATPPQHPSSLSQGGQGGLGGLGPLRQAPTVDWVALLNNVPTEELAEAAHSQEKFKALFHQLIARAGDKAAEVLQAAKAKLVEQAQRNLQKEVALNDVCNQIRVIRSTDCAAGIAEFNARRERVVQAIAPVTPDALLEGLRAAAVSTASESEQLVRSFMHGQMPVDEFIEQYGSLRASYHKRDLKRQAAMQTMSLRR